MKLIQINYSKALHKLHLTAEISKSSSKLLDLYLQRTGLIY